MQTQATEAAGQPAAQAQNLAAPHIVAAFEAHYFHDDAPAHAKEKNGGQYKYLATHVAWTNYLEGWCGAVRHVAPMLTVRGVLPPTITKEYPAQRWFSGHGKSYQLGVGSTPNRHAPPTEATVFRDAHDDLAELTISISTYAQTSGKFGPLALRELAARLIDAAHDIEEHPAAAIAGTRNVEQVPA